MDYYDENRVKTTTKIEYKLQPGDDMQEVAEVVCNLAELMDGTVTFNYLNGKVEATPESSVTDIRSRIDHIENAYNARFIEDNGIVIYQAPAGSRISEALKTILKTSQAEQKTVQTDFNGVILHAHPYDTYEDLCHQYDTAINSRTRR